MHRTQISLSEEQYEALRRESKKRAMSLSAVIRKLISAHLLKHEDQGDPLSTLAGIAEGTGEAIGREHNRFLYGKNRG